MIRIAGLPPARLLPAIACMIAPAMFTQISSAGETIDFRRDIRPILSENCFRCHGPDEAERQSILRLDQRSSVIHTELESGGFAVVPGDVGRSELIRRVTHDDLSRRMPPEQTGKSLTRKEVQLLKRWIQQGAKWERHWAFLPPQRHPLPTVERRDWPKNPIDHFVLARIESAEGEVNGPAAEADREALIRRVTFDLTGLPPTPEEVDRFVNDRSPDAYHRLVDRLLSSVRYGEHQARYWLDAARYGDTHGLHLDNERSIWPYRDWVIRALNANQPFDQFTIEQLAGDLLPEPTIDQLVATGFHRCNVTTSEGGSIAQEYLVRYAVDRAETTATTWMGLTAGCAACHDHKFDPLSQAEFYQLFAYFFNLSEKAMDGNALLPPPSVKAPTLAQRARQRRLVGRQRRLQARMTQMRGEATSKLSRWSADYMAANDSPTVPADAVFYCSLDAEQGAQATAHVGGKTIRAAVDGGIRDGDAAWEAARINNGLRFDGETVVEFGDVAGFRRTDPFTLSTHVYLDGDQAMTILSRMDESKAFRGYDLFASEAKIYVHLIHQWPHDAIRVNTRYPIVKQKWQHLCATYDGSGQAAGLTLYVDGQPQQLEVTHDSLHRTIRNEQPLRIGRRQRTAPLVGMLDEIRIYRRCLPASQVPALSDTDVVGQTIAIAEGQRTRRQRQMLVDFFLNKHNDRFRQVCSEKRQVDDRLRRLRGTFPRTLVLEEMSEPRQAYVLQRGEYDKPTDPVQPGVPAVLPPLPPGAPPNRLSLARWLVDPQHPLTARVTVNRIWQRYFGTGIVATSEDFGSQGEWPSHPKLLDWLAVEFVDSGWDLKAVHRLIVTSATYRQSARATPGAYRRDPENRLLARGPRFRMDAEMIRDQALFVSGLLVERTGGKSVKPYQPDGLWEAVGYTSSNTAQFERDHGAALYRRSLYTFWKRTSPPPSMQILDAPSREVCIVRRARTNTPIAALLLMNDVQFIEAARQLATRVLRWAGDWDLDPVADQRVLQRAFRCVVTRRATAAELNVVQRVLDDFRAEFQRDPEAARRLLEQGESQPDGELAVEELAAWTMVANLLLNLDEALVK